MNAHLFTADKGSKVCTECGKTRGAKAHKDAKLIELAAPAAEQVAADEAAAVAEARQDMLPEADASTDDSEIADALAALEADATTVAERTQTPAKKAVTVTDAASLWVGWRITNEAVLVHKNSPKAAKSLAAKLTDAKPTGDLDRTVKLTVEELAVLDGIAARFMEPGHTGPEQYSGRALRGRIATALAKIESGK